MSITDSISSAKSVSKVEDTLYYLENARVTGTSKILQIVSTTTGEIIYQRELCKSLNRNDGVPEFGFFNSPYGDTVFIVSEPYRSYCIYEEKSYNNQDKILYSYLLRLKGHDIQVEAIHIGICPKYRQGYGYREYEKVFEHVWDYCANVDESEWEYILIGNREYPSIAYEILSNVFSNTLVTIPVEIFV